VLIAINVFIFLWMLTDGVKGQLSGSGSITQHQIDFALFVGPDPRYGGVASGDWYRIVSAGFLHFGLLHIGFNMLLLWQLGNLIETGLGRVRFALLYFAALIGGSSGVVLASPNNITGGASGAVFGLMAAAAIGMQQRGINALQTPVGATLILNLLITFALPGVSIGGHIGGAITGAAVGYVMLHPRWQRTMPWISIAAPLVAIVASIVLIKSQLP
jgi:membrane associated rhomboid family serine protease